MSQKNRSWNVSFNNGKSVTVNARGKRMAQAKACVATGQPGTEIKSYTKQATRSHYGRFGRSSVWSGRW